MGLAEKKTFENLQNDVISVNRCCACGACIAYCESQAFDVIEMDNYTPKFKTDKSVENCKECGYCYYICPQTQPLLEKLKEVHNITDELGNIIDIVAAKATDEALQSVGQDGGVVSAMLTYLFDKNEIDGAIVSEYDDNLKPIPKIIYNKEDLFKSSGTRYTISSNLLPLKDLYEIAEDIVEAHHQIYDINQLRMAFVGTPCQCRAVRKMQLLNISPTHVIKYVFGLFCMENFDYDKLFELVKAETGLEPKDITKMNIKKNFFITNKANEVKEVELHKFDPAVRNHCKECDEFTSRFADISFGGSGAVQQNSMIIIRTENGQELITNAINDGYVQRFVPTKSPIHVWKGNKLDLLRRMTTNKVSKK